MQIYLVGGAVRDKLLSLPIKERDWVVVGSTPEEMIKLGFKPVGKEFPVFLHPETHEEYALARTERKVAKGYKGFSFYAQSDVTLEQDLLRRDLTINAIAMDDQGRLIDPYHGQQDLKQKILRHVSEAFAEDPVRILRLARLHCKFPEFTIANETLALMQKMVKAGEVEALVAERVWAELKRALEYTECLNFFVALNQCGALAILFPEINLEFDEKIFSTEVKPTIRLALLFHATQANIIKNLISRYRIPNEYADLALLVREHAQTYATLTLNSPTEILTFFKSTDAYRRSERLYDFIQAATLCYNIPENHNKIFLQLLNTAKHVDTKSLQQSGVKGADFAKALEKLRVEALNKYRC